MRRSFASVAAAWIALASTIWATQTQTGRSSPNLTGTWAFPEGTILAVTERNGRVEGRILAPTQRATEVWGWQSGDLFRRHPRRCRDHGHAPHSLQLATRKFCPKMWSSTTALELEVADADTIVGRYRNVNLVDDCSVRDMGWAPWTMTRRRFDLSETAKQIDISVRDSILFDVDRDVLKADAVAVLKDIKTLLLDRQPYSRLVVEGHTDDRGTAAYNLALSSRRAEAVAAWLSQNGVLRERLEIKGLGRTSPLVPNANDANRAKNRRVEIKLIKPS